MRRLLAIPLVALVASAASAASVAFVALGAAARVARADDDATPVGGQTPPPAPSLPRPATTPSHGEPRDASGPCDRAVGLREDDPCAVPWKTPKASLREMWHLPAGFGNGYGDVEINRVIADVRGQYAVTPRFSLTGRFVADYAHFDLSRPDAIVAGDGRLLDEATQYSGTLGFIAALNADWRVASTFTVISSTVPGARFEDSLTYGVDATVRRRLASGAGLIVGLDVSTTLDGNSFYLPYAYVEGLGTGPVRFEARGPGILVAYDVSDSLAVGLTAEYERKSFRLAPTDRLPEGLVRDLHIEVGLEVQWKPTPPVTVRVGVGVDAYSRMKFLDRDGHEVFDEDPETVPLLTFGVTAEF